MNIRTLTHLVAQKIDANKFHFTYPSLSGISWPDKADDTPENNAIVADVIKNYETLAAVAEKAIADEAGKEVLIQAKMREMAEAELIAEGKLEK